MSIFGANIPLLNKFPKNFTSCFSKKQMAMFTLVIYALFKDYKRNSLDAMAKATHTDYQKLQYFFSDSHWDIQALKRKRLEIIQKQRTTASTKDGLLAIDDTGCQKPFAKNTLLNFLTKECCGSQTGADKRGLSMPPSPAGLTINSLNLPG